LHLLKIPFSFKELSVIQHYLPNIRTCNHRIIEFPLDELSDFRQRDFYRCKNHQPKAATFAREIHH